MTNQNDDYLDRLQHALANLQPDQELPAELQHPRTPEQTLVDEWTDELAHLIVDKVTNPSAFHADPANAKRQQELLYILRNL